VGSRFPFLFFGAALIFRPTLADIPKPIDPNHKRSVVREFTVRGDNRRELRRKLAETWLLEEENSRYRYDVEVCANGRKVYLLRPTWLNKGFDFQINLEGFRSKSGREAPSHEDLINDLRAKRDEDPLQFGAFRRLIDRVYICEEPENVLLDAKGLAFRSGLEVDAVLKVLKWLFIEQDLTYWNNSGRRMFMGAIQELDRPITRAAVQQP
jgi:hypothetical protein